MVRASVIIPARGRVELLRHVLRRVDDQSWHDYEIIVVADSCKRVVDAVRNLDFQHPTRLFDTRDRCGFGALAARNLGAHFATGRLLIFLDADCLVGSEHIADYVQAFEDNAMLIGAIEYVAPEDWTQVIQREFRFSDKGGGTHKDRELERWWMAANCWSGNMAVDRRAFVEQGGFDRRFLGVGGEDVDFGMRFACRNSLIRFVPNPVRHVGLTSGILYMRGDSTPLDTSLIQELIAGRHYRPGSPDMIVNGGATYFEELDTWTEFSDLRQDHMRSQSESIS